ncbi:MAG: hypothetical protein ABGZ23_16060 [Fuerstiella sp.]
MSDCFASDDRSGQSEIMLRLPMTPVGRGSQRRRTSVPTLPESNMPESFTQYL